MSKYEKGDQTILMFEKILDNDYHRLLSEQEMQALSETHLFENGIIDRIYHLGYTGTRTNINEIIKFIVKKCEEHKIDLLRQTIKNWFDDINPAIPIDKKHGPPYDNAQSRPNVYKLCFALEMNADEVEAFFLKNYLCMPFNYKDSDEQVYYFCFKTNRSYENALELRKKIESIEFTMVCDNSNIFESQDSNEALFVETKALEIALSSIVSEEDFLNYMRTHKYTKENQYYTATRMIFGEQDSNEKFVIMENSEIKNEGLLSKCQRIAAIENKLRGFTANEEPIYSIDRLLNVVYGYDKRAFDKDKIPGLSKKSAFPKAIKKNFPQSQLFSIIKDKNKKEHVTADIYKKALTILCFYRFYGESTNKILLEGNEESIDLRSKADEFEMYLDETLDKCGFVQIYYRNPFDWLIMYCAGSPNPLKTFRDLIKKYYLDVIDEESYYD